MDGIATTVQLGAQVMGLDTNPYGGKGAFSQTETGESGQLNLIALIAVGFPTAVTLFYYKDNIFGPPIEYPPPPGWKKVESRSRPGQFSYKELKTGQVYDRLPNWAFSGDD